MSEKKAVFFHVSTKENSGARYNNKKLVQIAENAFQTRENAEGPPTHMTEDEWVELN